MSFLYAGHPMPMGKEVIRRQRLSVSPAVVRQLLTYRDACRLAWEKRAIPGLTQRTVAELAGLHPPHVSDYFSPDPSRRELPARAIGDVERVLGNTVISQWVAKQARLTVLEELQALEGEAA
ncbi:helix-turn-helix domain-containing protein [Eleftheria terrae]|uniref:helix-turn-helix domain-containing protein n=1 Tax=Eleftheria terrae TaxID=1597781 RepID=UPI00263BD48F|nr:helix-turn-helix transcriptional regulator [Eleftheria terrae]WKB52997.1 helix-turn-helix transcriptional regulator [Eleftheria terrae]